jgi:hypothetical protein
MKTWHIVLMLFMLLCLSETTIIPQSEADFPYVLDCPKVSQRECFVHRQGSFIKTVSVIDVRGKAYTGLLLRLHHQLQVLSRSRQLTETRPVYFTFTNPSGQVDVVVERTGNVVRAVASKSPGFKLFLADKPCTEKDLFVAIPEGSPERALPDRRLTNVILGERVNGLNFRISGYAEVYLYWEEQPVTLTALWLDGMCSPVPRRHNLDSVEAPTEIEERVNLPLLSDVIGSEVTVTNRGGGLYCINK